MVDSILAKQDVVALPTPGHVTIVAALMLASPLVTAVWIALQARGPAIDSARLRIAAIVRQSLPSGAPEAVTLAAAGYLGVVVAALVNPAQLAAALPLLNSANPLMYVALMAIVPLASNLALPSIVTVTFLGSLFSALPANGLNPDLIACALLWGWGLNLTASPFGGVPLILGRITGIAGTTLSWRWNGLFSLLLFGWCSFALIALSKLLTSPV